MRLKIGFVVTLLFYACATVPHVADSSLGRIIVSPDARGFVSARTHQPFHPWGMNYGNKGRLMEDFWDRDWQILADDFSELRALGANVVRVHLQYGKIMSSPATANTNEMAQLRRLTQLAERTHLYLDITGLACYR